MAGVSAPAAVFSLAISGDSADHSGVWGTGYDGAGDVGWNAVGLAELTCWQLAVPDAPPDHAQRVTRSSCQAAN